MTGNEREDFIGYSSTGRSFYLNDDNHDKLAELRDVEVKTPQEFANLVRSLKPGEYAEAEWQFDYRAWQAISFYITRDGKLVNENAAEGMANPVVYWRDTYDNREDFINEMNPYVEDQEFYFGVYKITKALDPEDDEYGPDGDDWDDEYTDNEDEDDDNVWEDPETIRVDDVSVTYEAATGISEEDATQTARDIIETYGRPCSRILMIDTEDDSWVEIDGKKYDWIRGRLYPRDMHEGYKGKGSPADILLAMNDLDDELEEANQAGRITDLTHPRAVARVKGMLRNSFNASLTGGDSPVKAQINDEWYNFWVIAVMPKAYSSRNKGNTVSPWWPANSGIDPNNPKDIAVCVVFKEKELDGEKVTLFIPAYRLVQPDPRFTPRPYQYEIKINEDTCGQDFAEFRKSKLLDNIDKAEQFFAAGNTVSLPQPKHGTTQLKLGLMSPLEDARHLAQIAIKKAIDADGRINYHSYNMEGKAGGVVVSYRDAQLGLNRSNNYLCVVVDSFTQIHVDASSNNTEVIQRIEDYAKAEGITLTWTNRRGDTAEQRTRGFVINVADAANLTQAELDKIVDKLYICYRLIKRAARI